MLQDSKMIVYIRMYMLIFDCSKHKKLSVYVSHDVVDEASTGTKLFRCFWLPNIDIYIYRYLVAKNI